MGLGTEDIIELIMTLGWVVRKTIKRYKADFYNNLPIGFGPRSPPDFNSTR
jgi:hypothetical protein